jgi:hypothetical protein
VSFEPGSNLRRIEDGTFLGCLSLRSLVIPGYLQLIGCRLFQSWTSLSELIFEILSHLRQLYLPPDYLGSLSIPDSVEVVYSGIGKEAGRHRLLQFGRKSCLMTIDMRHVVDTRGLDSDTQSGAFLVLCEEVLRRFRSKF